MALASLMLHIAHKGLLVAEPGSQFLGIGKVAAAIAAYVENHSLAEHEVLDNLVEVALADGRRETAVVYIAYVIVENAIAQSTGYAVVGTKVSALQGIAEVGGVVFVPAPVAAVIESGVEVYMSVFKCAEHIGKYLE